MSARGAKNRAVSPSQLSCGELQAERLYELLREGRMSKRDFTLSAKGLEKQSRIGGLYLRWLLFGRFVNDAQGAC